MPSATLRYAVAFAISAALACAPLFAYAAPSYPAGTLVKASGPAVYVIGGDGMRYAFPNERIYKTWYANFSNIISITDEQLAEIILGGNVTYKPGVRLIKIQTDPKVYAVGAKKTLRWVETESLARDLYGTAWAKNVDDVADAFFVDYEIGASIRSKTDYDPAWNVYRNVSIAAVTGGASTDDPSRLPRDVIRYPAAGFNVVSVTGNEAAAELATADTPTAVKTWYEAMAPSFGWVKRETLAQAVFGSNGRMSLSFRKTENDMTYDFTVSMIDSGTLTLYRAPTVELGFEGFPASVPTYRGGELLYRNVNAASSTAEYVALSSAKPLEVLDAMTSDLVSHAWRQIALEDVGTASIRKFERTVDGEMMNLLIVIGEITGVERNATAIVVRYGTVQTISAVDLEEIKSIFNK